MPTSTSIRLLTSMYYINVHHDTTHRMSEKLCWYERPTMGDRLNITSIFSHCFILSSLNLVFVCIYTSVMYQVCKWKSACTVQHPHLCAVYLCSLSQGMRSWFLCHVQYYLQELVLSRRRWCSEQACLRYLQERLVFCFPDEQVPQ